MKYIIYIFLLGILAYSSIEGYGLYQKQQNLSQAKEDFAEINKINYGLFNLDLWKQKAMTIFDDKITEFKISPQVYGELEDQVMVYLDDVYDEYIGSGKLVDGMIEEAEKSGVVNKMFLKLIKGNIGSQIEKLNIDKQLPQIAKAITKELKKNEPRIRYYVQQGLQDMLFAGAEEINIVDPRQHVYKRYQADNLERTNQILATQIADQTAKIEKNIQWLIVLLGIALLLGVLLYKLIGFKLFVSYITLLSIVLLVLGVSLPMIELDARLNAFEMNLLSSKVGFDEQVMYFQSKSILQVTQTLISEGGKDLMIVGYMVLMFSIIFPFIKLVLSAIFLFSKRVSRSRFAKGVIFHLGKWSMADVFVVALFMAFIGFHGLITSQLGSISRNETGFAIETLNYSRLAPGALFFTSYCILSIILGIIINKYDQRTIETGIV